jgi:hypothetical protein
MSNQVLAGRTSPPLLPWGALLALGLLAACGQQGPPRPPLRLTPVAPTELRVAQHGARVEVSARAPRLSVDGLRLPVLEIDFAWTSGRIKGAGPGDKRTVEAAPGELVLTEIAPAPAPGSVLSVTARARANRHESRPTAPVRFEARPVPPPPDALVARRVRAGVELQWSAVTVASATPAETPVAPASGAGSSATPSPTPEGPAAGASVPAPGAERSSTPEVPGSAVAVATASPVALPTPSPSRIRYWVYRRQENGSYGSPVNSQPTEEPTFVDMSLEADAAICFSVTAVTAVDPVVVESEASVERCVAAGKRRPVAPPQDVRAVAEGTSVTVTWKAADDPRVIGYCVYRIHPDGSPEKIAEVGPAVGSYRDPLPSQADRVSYVITALDRERRESMPAGVTASRPGER